MSRVSPEVLPLIDTADLLARRFVAEGIVPPKRLDDARHVACAIMHGIDLLVSWNYRHIASQKKADGFNAVAVLCGHAGNLRIHTPFEVL